MVYSILNESDASIKKLNNIYIDTNGYELNGTMIGFDIIDYVNDDANWVYQNNRKLYCKYIHHWSDHSVTAYTTAYHANIIYV